MQLALVVIVVVVLEERLILGIRRRRVSHLSLVHSTGLLRLIRLVHVKARAILRLAVEQVLDLVRHGVDLRRNLKVEPLLLR